MRLTGKAKEQFEKWYNDNYEFVELPSIDDSFCLDTFYELPESMQCGVYQDWADSLGYELFVSKDSPIVYYWAVSDLINCLGCKDGSSALMTRQEARNAAIEKLNEIINEK